MKQLFPCLALLLAVPSFASAAPFYVPPSSQWSNPADENGNGTGWSAVTTTQPRGGNGTIELHGDRTRFVAGSLYDSGSNLGLFSDIANYSFDFMIPSDSQSNLQMPLTPALRLHVWDPTPAGSAANRSELIWEGAYNGVTTSTEFAYDEWFNSTDFGSKFYQWNPATGVVEQLGQTLDWWQTYFGGDAYIMGLSVGVGSSAGADYYAFADNITLHFTDNTSTSVNFEAAVVPEPSAIAIWSIIGLSLGAVVWRRRRAAA